MDGSISVTVSPFALGISMNLVRIIFLILSLFFERFLKFIMWNCTLLVNFIITNQIGCNIVSSRIFSFLFPNAIIGIIRVDKIRFVINCYCSDSQIVGSLIIVFYSTQHWLRLQTWIFGKHNYLGWEPRISCQTL